MELKAYSCNLCGGRLANTTSGICGRTVALRGQFGGGGDVLVEREHAYLGAAHFCESCWGGLKQLFATKEAEKPK